MLDRTGMWPLILPINVWAGEDGIDSNHFYFPETLALRESNNQLAKFTLVGRIFATRAQGLHFYSLVKLERPMPGIYRHDGMVNQGYAVREENNHIFVGNHTLSLCCIYAME